MRHKELPILNIQQFQNTFGEDSFYANIFSSHLRCNHTQVTTPHKHNFYLSVCFTHGHGTHEIDFQSFPIQAGSVFFLHPGQTHNWELSDDIEGYIFFHSRAFYDRQFARKSILDFPIFHSSRFKPFLQLPTQQITKVMETFQTIVSEYPIQSIAKGEKVCSLLDVFYIDISEQLCNSQAAWQVNSNRYLSKINQLELFIEENFKHVKLPHVYAQKMNMTPKHLNRICKNVLGTTTSQLINDRVILEAKRLLVHPESTLTHTANDLGFKDYAYFSRWYKKQTGETPSQFKQHYYK